MFFKPLNKNLKTSRSVISVQLSSIKNFKEIDELILKYGKILVE